MPRVTVPRAAVCVSDSGITRRACTTTEGDYKQMHAQPSPLLVPLPHPPTRPISFVPLSCTLVPRLRRGGNASRIVRRLLRTICRRRAHVLRTNWWIFRINISTRFSLARPLLASSHMAGRRSACILSSAECMPRHGYNQTHGIYTCICACLLIS